MHPNTDQLSYIVRHINSTYNVNTDVFLVMHRFVDFNEPADHVILDEAYDVPAELLPQIDALLAFAADHHEPIECFSICRN